MAAPLSSLRQPQGHNHLVSWLFFPQISGRDFLPQLCGEIHPETAPLQALCCALCTTEQSTFRGGEQREKVPWKGEKSERGQTEKRTRENRPVSQEAWKFLSEGMAGETKMSQEKTWYLQNHQIRTLTPTPPPKKFDYSQHRQNDLNSYFRAEVGEKLVKTIPRATSGR